jgi:hypothetical protein
MNLTAPPQGVDEKGLARHDRLQRLLVTLSTYELSEDTTRYITAQLNLIGNQPTLYSKEIAGCFQKIVNRIAFKEKLVLPKHYLNLWIGVGMGAFGVPIGVAFSAAIENMAFIGAGLPVGIALGAAIGAGLDNKAKAEGRVLNL